MVELANESETTVNMTVIQTLRQAKAEGEFNVIRDFWSVNLDIEQIKREMNYLVSHKDQMLFMKYMHPRLLLLVAEKLGWPVKEILEFKDECEPIEEYNSWTKQIQGS